jgi:hypothetical protein
LLIYYNYAFLKKAELFFFAFSISLKYTEALRNNNSQNQNISKKLRNPHGQKFLGQEREMV